MCVLNMQYPYTTHLYTLNIQGVIQGIFVGQIRVLQLYVNSQTGSPPERFSTMQAHLWKLIAMFLDAHPGIF